MGRLLYGQTHRQKDVQTDNGAEKFINGQAKRAILATHILRA